MSGAAFEYADHDRGKYISLYYEDDCIAVNTAELRGRLDGSHRTSYHEIMLNPRAVELLIDALTTMQADIHSRYQKAIEP